MQPIHSSPVSASLGDLRHHGGAQIQDLDVLAGAVQQPALVHGQLFTDHRLLSIREVVIVDYTVVDLNGRIFY